MEYRSALRWPSKPALAQDISSRRNPIEGRRLQTMSPSEDRYRAPRLVAFLTVVLSQGAAHYVVDTENVSETGLCLCPKKLFPVGTHLHLAFGQPPDLPTMTARGIVRWNQGGKGVGVEFTLLSPDDHKALRKFVNSQSHGEKV